MVRKASGLVLTFLFLVATSASAQSLSVTGLKLNFGAETTTAVTPSGSVSFDSDAAPVLRGDTASWVPIVLAGLIANGGGGLYVGGGVLGENFMGNPNFNLQIEGAFALAGGGCAFDDCSAQQILVGAIFWYLFEEMTNGWQPYVGGGLMFSRISYDFDDLDDTCEILDLDCDFDDSAIGVVVGGGIRKNRLAFEGLFGSFYGGGAIVRLRYSFGGSN